MIRYLLLLNALALLAGAMLLSTCVLLPFESQTVAAAAFAGLLVGAIAENTRQGCQRDAWTGALSLPSEPPALPELPPTGIEIPRWVRVDPRRHAALIALFHNERATDAPRRS